MSRTWRDAKFELLGAAVLCAGVVVVDLFLEPRSEVWDEAVGIAVVVLVVTVSYGAILLVRERRVSRRASD